MRAAGRHSRVGAIIRVGLGALVLMLVAATAGAQTRLDTAEVTRVTGRVEMLRQGQPPWLAVPIGARLGVHDEIRALAGGSAELRLPDSSTLFLAENSRIVLTKLQFNPGTQTRDEAILHLAVGKLRAVIATAALTLVRVRQSNFAISTPVAVAAARGTDFTTSFNPGDEKVQSAMLIGDTSGEVVCIDLGTFQAEALFPGDVFRKVGPGGCIRFSPSSADRTSLFGGRNGGTENHPALFGAVTVIDPQLVSGLISPQAKLSTDTGFGATVITGANTGPVQTSTSPFSPR